MSPVREGVLTSFSRSLPMTAEVEAERDGAERVGSDGDDEDDEDDVDKDDVDVVGTSLSDIVEELRFGVLLVVLVTSAMGEVSSLVMDDRLRVRDPPELEPRRLDLALSFCIMSMLQTFGLYCNTATT
jgi:hypothetical protein